MGEDGPKHLARENAEEAKQLIRGRQVERPEEGFGREERDQHGYHGAEDAEPKDADGNRGIGQQKVRAGQNQVGQWRLLHFVVGMGALL